MADIIPSVNPPAKHDIPDSEGAKTAWVDPIFAEMNPERMSDEPAPTPEEIKAREAEKAEAEKAERDAKGEPSPEQLKALLEENPDAGEDEDGAKDDDGAPAEGGDKAEEAEPEGDEKEGEEPAGGKDASQPKRRRSRARRERRAMERRIAAMAMEIESLKKAPDDAEEAGPAEEAKAKPTLEDFDYDTDAFEAALSEWADEQVKASKESAAQAEDSKVAEEAHRKDLEVFREREEGTRDKHDDYDDLVYDPAIFIPEHALAVIMESEQGPDLAYYLATHQDEALALKDASEVAVARALGRIEAQLASAPGETTGEDEDSAEEAQAAEEARATNAPAAKPRTSTKAPDPIKTVGGGGSAHGRDPSKMSMDEYVEARRSGKIK